MGSGSSSLLHEEIETISKETGFSSGQVKRLYNRFTNLDKDNTGYLTKSSLGRIPELHVNPLRDRIIDVLISDYGSNNQLNFRQFAKVLATFRRKTSKHDEMGTNSREKKLKFIFDVYDRDKDNKISKAELMSILGLLVGANLPEEQLNAIAERTIIELGPDSEIEAGISYEKFCNSLLKIDIDDKMSMKFLS